MDLLERDRELVMLSDAFAEAVGGSGSGLAICGEPGAGKSVLVTSACAQARGLRILRGGCDPLSTPRPLGPFRELSASLGVTDLDGAISATCTALHDALRTEPTALIIEDIHWVDSASVEVLRFLVRRLDVMPCALVVTYRDEEMGVHHPARPLLGDLAASAQVTTLRLAPMTVTAVAQLLAGGALDARQVHRVTGGNPFFVAEVAKEPDRPLPATVRDAVLARISGITPDDLEVLQLAAAAPNRLDDRVLPALGLDLPTLRRLYDTGLLSRDERGIVFRHELSRLALESTIPAGGAARLHARLLSALEQLPNADAAVLTHHAVAAGDPDRASRYARQAARESARSGSHSEAAAFLRIALDGFAGATRDQAGLQVRLGLELYQSGQLDAAISSIEASFPLWQRIGDLEGLSRAHDSCAVLEYYNADRRQAEHHANRAMRLAAGAQGAGYGSALATGAYLAYLRTEFELGGRFLAEGSRIAGVVGDDALGLRTQLIEQLSQLAQSVPGARERCLDVVERARDVGLDELASMGYSQLTYLDVEQARLPMAERLLEIPLPFAAERGVRICQYWQSSVRSRLRLREGRWSAALEDARFAMTQDGMPVAWPLIVTGLTSLRRDGSGAEHLDAAWRLAGILEEPMRLVPALAALAEHMWVTGTPDDRVTDASGRLREWADQPALRWAVGDLTVWLRRLGIDAPVEATALAQPHRLHLSGAHLDAATWWHDEGAAFEEALARTDAADAGSQLDGIERLDLLGATASADRIRLVLRQQGVAVPPRPRKSTRANPAGLTNRQLEVAKLVARGLTNAEIAARLFISPKTTDHHVSAVLSKLGMSSRRAVDAQGADLGLS